MLESRTVLQQRHEYATLEPYWDGARERNGEALGLSSYAGRSSIYHSASWADSDDCEQRQENRQRIAAGVLPVPVRVLGRGRRVMNFANDPAILERLRKGCSYNGISRELGVSVSVVRRVGRENGIDRRQFASWHINHE